MSHAAKAALVTGARRSIGRGIALALADAGYDIGINDILLEDADETLRLICEKGRQAEFLLYDTSDSAQVNAMFAEFLERFGRIDALVNNAYFANHTLFLDITESDWDKTLDVCLKGYFLCSQQAARAMVEQKGGGSIVSISSVHSERVWPTDTAYGVAKAGIERMTKSMAVNLGQYDIRANAILPGYVSARHEYGSPMPKREDLPERMVGAIPAGRYATPEDIGKAVAFLVSDAASNISGVSIPVDGAFLCTGIPS